ncbi:MAG: signal transduction histidine kinase [Ulvibacter sp.]|jgi:signal transduction histidine kinase
MITTKRQTLQLQKTGALLALLLWVATASIAQNQHNDIHLEIQALKQELKTVKTDSVQARLANDISSRYLSLVKMDSCRKYARLAIKKTRNNLSQDKIKKVKAQALENLGYGLSLLYPKQGVDTLLSAQELWKELKNNNGIGITHHYIGNIFTNLGEFPQAIEAYKKSLLFFEKAGNKKYIATLWLQQSITQRYMGNNGDALENGIEALQIAREIKDTLLMTDVLLANGFNYMLTGNFSEAREVQEEALEITIRTKDSIGISTVYNDLAVTATQSGNFDDALKNHREALDLRKKLHDDLGIGISYSYIATILKIQGKLEKALLNARESKKYTDKYGDFRFMLQSYLDIGEIYLELGDYERALENYNDALNIAEEKESIDMQVISLTHIGEALRLLGNNEAALIKLYKAERIALSRDFQFRRDIYSGIVATYISQKDYKNAFENQLIYQQLNDSIIVAQKAEKITKLTQKLIYDNQKALQKASQDKEIAIKESQIKQQKLVRNLSMIGLLAGVVISFILFLKFKEKRRLNLALEESLSNLKATQGQLIQSEKMASLGELTAGIAHEIQNPLNFVTNFSEVSNELIDEMNEEIEKGDIEEARLIASDIKQNLEKINHHGKRADGIVKSMLQHSRSSTGKKEPTDINKLADEYLRLAYHGLRAKNQSFNAILETNYDANIGQLEVITQDLGRVILNLITNAFYACNEKNSSFDKATEAGYKPTVYISTKKNTDSIEIKVTDNGNGMSEAVKEKIFQPFFTTKPTGQGTGLGLSMSYDIISKSHEGELKVETIIGKGTTFTIILPTNK